MAIYGKNREQWKPTKVKSKTSKNKTYEITKVSQSITGASVTANPDSNTSTESAQNTTDWYYFSGNAGTGNNTSEDPKQPSSGVPIQGGGTYANEIYAFTGGGDPRILASKTPFSGAVTISFKVIECGGGGTAIPARIFNPDGSSAGNAMGGLASAKDWLGGSSDAYDPIQVVYTTDAPPSSTNSTWSTTWTVVSGTDMHGHGDSHPNAGTANLDRTELKTFTHSITVPAGSYIGIRQDAKSGVSNSWAIADLQIVLPDRTINRNKLSDNLWTHLRIDESNTIELLESKRETVVSTNDYYLQGHKVSPTSILPTTWTPTHAKVTASRYAKAIYFEDRNASNTNQQLHNYIRETAGEWSPDQLFGDSGSTYSEAGARQIYISFWVKINRASADNDGHAFAHWCEAGNSTDSQPYSVDPKMGFFINASGGVSMRFFERHNSPGNVNAGAKYATTGNTPSFYEVSSDNGLINVGQWHHVTFALKFTAGFDVAQFTSNTMVFVDGDKTAVPPIVSRGNGLDLYSGDDEAEWEWQFGSLINSIGSYDSGDNKVRRSSGFSGALGEFTVITQSGASDAERIAKAKFLYEAQREGAFHLHSGIHNSSPRLELYDLDKDTAYPSNFSMPVFTKFQRKDYYGYDEDNADSDNEESTGIDVNTIPKDRVSLRSTERFTEGYNASDVNYTWRENASQYHVRSTFSSGTETVAVMPHLQLNPSDTILTNGNWYSDARSEFFAEDLHATDGFVINPANDSASTKYVPKTSDELYKEHLNDGTVTPFIDERIPPEYNDCYVIEIPLPNINSLKLSTDAEDFGGNERVEHKNYNASGNSGTTQDSNQKIHTMAYYNFRDSKWEHVLGNPFTTFSVAGRAGGYPWLGTGDIGFTPMSGLVFPIDGNKLEYYANQYGKPTTDFGFPIHKKFESDAGQTIDLSKYLDESVILEGWEIYTNVIPRVGYSHDISSGAADHGDDEGHKEAYGTLAKSPLYYGATGDACVLWDERQDIIPFREKSIGSGATAYRYDNSIPVSNFNSDGNEIDPTKTSKGLVTKGVTAFLLKETDLFDKRQQRAKFLRSQPRYQFGSGNDRNSSKTYVYNRPGIEYIPNEQWNTATDTSIDATTASSVDGTMFPRLSYEFYEPDTARYDNGSSRELVGYLQHVFHNDPHADKDRKLFRRKESSTYYGNNARWNETNVIKALGKENNTYVSNLLRQNTSKYAMHASGSAKIQTQMAGSFPMSNFKIAGTSNGSLGVYRHHAAAGSLDLYHTDAIVPSSEGSPFSDLIQHDSTPNVAHKSSIQNITVPKGVYPAGTPTTSLSDWSTAALTTIAASKVADESSDVVLRPTDKLILGIQDSVSTTFASQQIQGEATDSEFVRWGRNYLEMPVDRDGYLRLYVKRTRNDKQYNVVSDDSTYNANVNRDIGDHYIDDDFMINPPLMYSGSMADDIMGPTTFTPPTMSIEVPAFSSSNTAAAANPSYLSNFAKNVKVLDQGERHGYGLTAPYWGGGNNNHSDWSDSGFTNIPWNSMSKNVFDQRGQNATPRFPSITWTDYSDFDKKGVAGSTQYKGNYSLLEFLEGIQWVITKPNPSSGNAGGAGTWNASAAASAGLNPSTQPKMTPFWLSSGFVPSPPQKFRYKPFCTLSEVNTNSGASATGHVVFRWQQSSAYHQADVSRAGNDCPGISAWSLKLLLPYFKYPTNQITPIVDAMQVDFRLVMIQKENTSNGLIPTYHDDTNMAVGDAFYFNASQQAIKIKSASDLQTAKNSSSLEADDYWSRQWYSATARQAARGPMIYIVAAAVSVNNYDIVSDTTDDHVTRTWWQINEKIADIIHGQEIIEDSLLCTVDTSKLSTAGKFSVILPQDTVLRKELSSAVDEINALSAFQLCGLDVATNSTTAGWPTNTFSNIIRIYHDDTADSDGVIDHSMAHWGGDLGISASYSSSNNAVQNLPHQNVLLGTAPATKTTNYTSETNGSGTFLKDYLTPMKSITRSAAATAAGVSASNYSSLPDIDHITIDYTGLTSSSPKLVITAETYTPFRKNAIDRFVQRRSSELYNVSDSTKPLIPGPFGSLKNFNTMPSGNIVYDSQPAKDLAGETLTGYCPTHEHKTKTECNAHVGTGHANTGDGTSNVWVETNYMTLVTDVPQSFPFENSDERLSQVVPRNLKINMKTSTSGGRDASNTSTVEYTEATGDTSVGDYNWGFSGASTSGFTVGSTGLINVTNYIQDGFKGNANFTNKTVSDLLVGFGNGAQSKHMLRPDLYDFVAWTGSTPVKFSTQYIIDKPRGARFGQYNTVPMSGTYKFSYRHFGYVRDMLEQSLDTRITAVGTATNRELFESPVTVSAVSLMNPFVPKEMSETRRYNKTTHATVTKPYIENGNLLQTATDVRSRFDETLRVNIPGALGSSTTAGPGNLASSIYTGGS